MDTIFYLKYALIKRSVPKVQCLAVAWEKKNVNAPHPYRTALAHELALANRNQDAHVCEYTNAFNAFRSGIAVRQ